MKSLTIFLCLLAFPLLATAQVKDESQLTGTIMDVQGSIIIGAIIKAVDVTGKTYEAISNNDGNYLLKLPYNKYDSKSTKRFKASRYDITVEGDHFEPTQIKGYIFIPSQFGKMRLDIALELRQPTELYVGGPEVVVIR